jgi:hypothetical protein
VQSNRCAEKNGATPMNEMYTRKARLTKSSPLLSAKRLNTSLVLLQI